MGSEITNISGNYTTPEIVKTADTTQSTANVVNVPFKADLERQPSADSVQFGASEPKEREESGGILKYIVGATIIAGGIFAAVKLHKHFSTKTVKDGEKAAEKVAENLPTPKATEAVAPTPKAAETAVPAPKDAEAVAKTPTSKDVEIEAEKLSKAKDAEVEAEQAKKTILKNSAAEFAAKTDEKAAEIKTLHNAHQTEYDVMALGGLTPENLLRAKTGSRFIPTQGFPEGMIPKANVATEVKNVAHETPKEYVYTGNHTPKGPKPVELKIDKYPHILYEGKDAPLVKASPAEIQFEKAPTPEGIIIEPGTRSKAYADLKEPVGVKTQRPEKPSVKSDNALPPKSPAEAEKLAAQNPKAQLTTIDRIKSDLSIKVRYVKQSLSNGFKSLFGIQQPKAIKQRKK